MATNFKWQAIKHDLPSTDNESGSFSITDDNAAIDFVFKMFGYFIVIYHLTA